jgi:HSP20 family protein
MDIQRRTTKMPEQAKAVTTAKPATSPAPLKLVPPTDLFKRMQHLQDEIAKRAFALFESHGRGLGRDLEHWFKAESELLHPVHVDVSESDNNLIVKAEVPGFTAKELEVALEPKQVTITGKRETKEERKDRKTIFSEIRSDQVLRVIDLPSSVATDKATASLKDGVLELTMPKAAPTTKVQIAEKEAKQDEQC